jgi:hypothetical protein
MMLCPDIVDLLEMLRTCGSYGSFFVPNWCTPMLMFIEMDFQARRRAAAAVVVAVAC